MPPSRTVSAATRRHYDFDALVASVMAIQPMTERQWTDGLNAIGRFFDPFPFPDEQREAFHRNYQPIRTIVVRGRNSATYWPAPIAMAAFYEIMVHLGHIKKR